jgi:hypothetical protein
MYGNWNYLKVKSQWYEKWEKQSFQPFCDHPGILLVRHSFSNSEVLRLLSRVIAVNLEYRMLAHSSPSRYL